MIAIVDYGVNNIASVVRALAAAGHTATLTADPDVVRHADRVVMPGVGNFGRASENLRESGLGSAVVEVARKGRPLLGLCLGMQLFFECSEEAPEGRGMALLPGRVEKFRTGLPVPHVGWASVRLTDSGRAHPVLAPLFPAGEEFYYHVHSYHPAGLSESVRLANGDYGGEFPTIVGRDNLLGLQFHPEKSQRAGVALLAAFADWAP
ncbi:MAG: imidazole glycerol phosphate synthase subunit HisH [Gemmatimonadota bacterium]